MIIGNIINPRAFKKISRKELGLGYHANGKAWMTRVLFLDSLKRFDSVIGKKNGRAVATAG